MLDDVYDAADDASVIDTRGTVRTGKERFDTLQLAFRKDKTGYAYDTSMSSVYPVFTSLGIMSPDPNCGIFWA